MRLLIRCVVVCLVVTSAAVPAGARGRSTPPPQAPRPVTVATLKAQANQAAARYAAAQTASAQLDDQIAALATQHSHLAGRLGPSRHRITRQPAALYPADVP